VNAVVATLQRTGIWNPFSFEDVYDLHIRTVGLMGNPNYVGSYLLTAAIAAIAATIAMKRYRLMMVTFAVIVVAGLLASQSIAAIVSLVIGMMAMTLPARRKSMRFATLAAGVILALVAVTYGPVRDRIANMSELARRGQYLELSSRRTPAYLAAWSMFTDNPLTGVGPGTFHWWYMPVRIELDKVYGLDLHKVSENFGEVHNDHLQLLAETGLPGYLIFLAALTYISLISFLHRRSTSPDTEKSRFIRFFGFPSAVAVFAVCLAQFPLQLPASIVTNIGFAALFLAMHADETRR
jgi:O-antigen ligase